MEKNFLSHKNILITSPNFIRKSPEIDEEKLNIELKTIPKVELYFPMIRYNILDKKEEKLNIVPFIFSKEEKIFLRNMRTFVAPINRTNLERSKLKNIKKNLVLKRFKELHKYKLKINPKNYYHNYGLNNYIIITNKNKSRNPDYRYNNISSYNNKFKIKEEKKNNGINSISENFKKNSKEFSLKRVPYRLKNQRKQNGIMKYFFNDEKTLFDVNSIWRGKNINDLIHTTINFNFFDNFRINSRTIGKIKFHE